MSRIQARTTIRNGLPVVAEGTVILAAGPLGMPGEAVAVACPGWGDEVDDIQISFRSGHAFRGELTEEDLERVREDLIAVARQDAEEGMLARRGRGRYYDW